MAAAGAEPSPVYLDNSATTPMSPAAVDAATQWMARPAGRPRDLQKLSRLFCQRLAAEGGFSLDGPQGYTLVLTSGTAEGNAHVLTTTVRAYATRTTKMPHVILGAAEHGSLHETAAGLVRDRLAILTVLPTPTRVAAVPLGTADPEDLRAAIRPNTCLISIAAADGETGTINDLEALGAVAHSHQIPFHTDAAHTFGRASPAASKVDAFSASFHRLRGPPGIGVLALRNDFVEGYCLGALIPGAPGEMRGGVVNGPGVAGAYAAVCELAELAGLAKDTAEADRGLRDGIWEALSRRFTAVDVDEYRAARPRAPAPPPAAATTERPAAAAEPPLPQTRSARALAKRLDAAEADPEGVVLVRLGPAAREETLPGVLTFAVARRRGAKIRAALERHNVFAGAEEGESRVLTALGTPPELCLCVIRVSLRNNTVEDAAAFVSAFTRAVSPRKKGSRGSRGPRSG